MWHWWRGDPEQMSVDFFAEFGVKRKEGKWKCRGHNDDGGGSACYHHTYVLFALHKLLSKIEAMRACSLTLDVILEDMCLVD
jgi:hypothetical protein